MQKDFQVVHGGVIQAAFRADAVTEQHEHLVFAPRFLQPGEDFFPVLGELVVDALGSHDARAVKRVERGIVIVGAEHAEVSQKHGIAFRRPMPAGIGKADGSEAVPAHRFQGRQDLFARVVFHGAAGLFRQVDMGVHVIHGMHADFMPVPADIFQQAQLFPGEEMNLLHKERGMGVIAAEQIEGAVPFLDAVVVKGDGHAGPGRRRAAARSHRQAQEQGQGGDSQWRRGFHANGTRWGGTPGAKAGDPE